MWNSEGISSKNIGVAYYEDFKRLINAPLSPAQKQELITAFPNTSVQEVLISKQLLNNLDNKSICSVKSGQIKSTKFKGTKAKC